MTNSWRFVPRQQRRQEEQQRIAMLEDAVKQVYNAHPGDPNADVLARQMVDSRKRAIGLAEGKNALLRRAAEEVGLAPPTKRKYNALTPDWAKAPEDRQPEKKGGSSFLGNIVGLATSPISGAVEGAKRLAHGDLRGAATAIPREIAADTRDVGGDLLEGLDRSRQLGYTLGGILSGAAGYERDPETGERIVPRGKKLGPFDLPTPSQLKTIGGGILEGARHPGRAREALEQTEAAPGVKVGMNVALDPTTWVAPGAVSGATKALTRGKELPRAARLAAGLVEGAGTRASLGVIGGSAAGGQLASMTDTPYDDLALTLGGGILGGAIAHNPRALASLAQRGGTTLPSARNPDLASNITRFGNRSTLDSVLDTTPAKLAFQSAVGAAYGMYEDDENRLRGFLTGAATPLWRGLADPKVVSAAVRAVHNAQPASTKPTYLEMQPHEIAIAIYGKNPDAKALVKRMKDLDDRFRAGKLTYAEQLERKAGMEQIRAKYAELNPMLDEAGNPILGKDGKPKSYAPRHVRPAGSRNPLPLDEQIELLREEKRAAGMSEAEIDKQIPRMKKGAYAGSAAGRLGDRSGTLADYVSRQEYERQMYLHQVASDVDAFPEIRRKARQQLEAMAGPQALPMTDEQAMETMADQLKRMVMRFFGSDDTALGVAPKRGLGKTYEQIRQADEAAPRHPGKGMETLLPEPKPDAPASATPSPSTGPRAVINDRSGSLKAGQKVVSGGKEYTVSKPYKAGEQFVYLDDPEKKRIARTVVKPVAEPSVQDALKELEAARNTPTDIGHEIDEAPPAPPSPPAGPTLPPPDPNRPDLTLRPVPANLDAPMPPDVSPPPNMAQQAPFEFAIPFEDRKTIYNDPVTNTTTPTDLSTIVTTAVDGPIVQPTFRGSELAVPELPFHLNMTEDELARWRAHTGATGGVQEPIDPVEMTKYVEQQRAARGDPNWQPASDLTPTTLKERSRWDQKILNVLNAPRTLISSGDASFELRQGLLFNLAHPIQGAKNLKTIWGALLSRDPETRIKGTLLARHPNERLKVVQQMIDGGPRAGLEAKTGLYEGLILPEEVGHVRLSKREEAYASSVLSNLRAKNPIENANILGLRLKRKQLFNLMADQIDQQGGTYKDYENAAKFAKVSTGRGELGVLNELGPWINAFFFSPRFLASRLELPFYMLSSTPAVRKEAARQFGVFAASGVATLVALDQAAKAFGLDFNVEADPRSSDFGKLRMGDQRYELWGGYQPLMRSFTQIALGQKKSTTSGEVNDISRMGAFGDFLLSKASPVGRAVNTAITGQQPYGDEIAFGPSAGPFNLGSATVQAVVPLFIQDAIDGFRTGGPLAAAGVLPSFIGVGAQNYAPLTRSLDEKAATIAKTNPADYPKGDATTYHDLLPADRKALRESEPQAWKNYVRAVGGKLERSEKAADEVAARQMALQNALLSGKLDRRQFVTATADSMLELSARRKEIYGDEPMSASDVKTPVDAFYYQIQQAEDPETKQVNWGKVDAWRDGLSAADRELIDRNTGLGGSPLYRMYREARREYADLPKYRGYTADEAQDIDEAWTEIRNRARSADRSDMLVALSRNGAALDPRIKTGVRRRILGLLPEDKSRERWKKANPVEASLFKQGTLLPAEQVALKARLRVV